MNKRSFISLLILILFLAFTITAISRGQGANIIKLDGGNRGDIAFPHHIHQRRLGDCNICHNLFPKSKKSISKLIAKGDLRKKLVMSKCQQCHSKTKMENKKSGPVNCSGCHNK